MTALKKGDRVPEHYSLVHDDDVILERKLRSGDLIVHALQKYILEILDENDISVEGFRAVLARVEIAPMQIYRSSYPAAHTSNDLLRLVEKNNPKLIEFMYAMSRELKLNEGKGNWEDFKNPMLIFSELLYHQAKLVKEIQKMDLIIALQKGNEAGDQLESLIAQGNKIKEHIADCANFFLMLGNTYDLYNE